MIKSSRTVIVVFFSLYLLALPGCRKGPVSEPAADTGDLIEQIGQITDSLPEKPGPEATDDQWHIYHARNYELKKARIELIEELEKRDIPDEQLNPYIEMKVEDIKKCFYQARLEANKFESKVYRMRDNGSPLAQSLATELLWDLNIYHVNTHLMHLSETDAEQIADFEMSRKDDPRAGRLMAQAIRKGSLSKDAKVKWSTWILDNMPPESEGYELTAAKAQLIADATEVEFSGEDLNGNSIDLKDFRGNVVLVDYWAFWCGICLAEIPELKKFNDNYHDQGLRIIGVFNDHRVDELKEYVKKHQISWPQLVTPNATKSSYMHPLAKKYGITGLPRYMLFAKDGRLMKTGGRVEALKPTILELLSQE
ncbi:MAG: TlpA family protein disulfide reductase [Planctomycetes bacterium]|nr:TlpA family protein disulfide reductase [Planctomycetota bacterium]